MLAEKNQGFKYSMNGVKLAEVEEEKDLGVWVTKDEAYDAMRKGSKNSKHVPG